MMQLSDHDSHWQQPPTTASGVTRRFIIAMAIIAAAAILLAAPLLQLTLAVIGPIPLTYANVPFPVCSPRSQAICLPLTQGESFKPGDVVPILATRCINNLLGGESLFPYHVDRNLVSVTTNTRLILPDFGSAGPNGCTTSMSLANQLPIAVAPGDYYLEGISTAYGRFRTINAYWRSQVFTVTKPEAE